MEQPLMTVIILVYKNMKYLDQAVESVLVQDYPRIELVISDDGSEGFDPAKVTEHFADRCAALEQFLVRKNSRNCGTVQNFNHAIQESHGEIICPLACDDCFAGKDVLTKIAQGFAHSDALAMLGLRQPVDAEGNCVGKPIPVPQVEKILSYPFPKWRRWIALNGGVACGAILYYRRAVFEKYGLFDEEFRLLEDYSFEFRMAVAEERIGYLGFVTIRYRMAGVASGKKMHPLLAKDHELMYVKYRIPQSQWWKPVVTQMWHRRVAKNQGPLTAKKNIQIALRYPLGTAMAVLLGMRERLVRKQGYQYWS